MRPLTSGPRRLRKLYLYDDPSMENLLVEELAEFAGRHLPGVTIETRPDMFSHFIDGDEPRLSTVARKFAEARLPLDHEDPLPMEVKVEGRRLREPEKLVRGIIYDGVSTLMLVWELIPEEEAGPESLHVAFTSRLVGTLDPGGGRNHARVILCAHQAVISTVGMVEGPARRKEYYLERSVRAALGVNPGAAAPGDIVGSRKVGEGGGDGGEGGDREGNGGWGNGEQDHLEVDDPRLTEVAKGYLLQAVFHRIAPSPFCADPRCRLFDAHTQRDMLAAQQGEPGLCGRHEALSKGLFTDHI